MFSAGEIRSLKIYNRCGCTIGMHDLLSTDFLHVSLVSDMSKPRHSPF
jgi:hypothetical protein